MSFRMVVTALGRAKLAAAIANKTPLNLSTVAVGDGGGVAVEPDEAQSGLVRETYRAPINTYLTDPTNPTYAIVELVIPTDVGGWTVREVGVFDNAGDLIAVGNFADTYKPLATEGTTKELVIRVIFEVGSPDAVELKIDATVVLATRAWTQSIANLAHLMPGGTAGMVLAKRSNQDGDVEWVNLADGITVLVDAKEERQSLASGQVTVKLDKIITTGAAIYIDGARIPKWDGEGTAPASPHFEIVNETDIKLTPAATGGEVFLAVRNNSESSLGFLAKNQNLADLPDKPAARKNIGLGDDDLKKLLLDFVYPVGSIYAAYNATSPATRFGGTWAAIEGTMLVGFKSSDSDFNAVGKTGGTKTHTLTNAQLPGHIHRVPSQTVTTGSAGAHSHRLQAPLYGEQGVVNDHIASGGAKQESKSINLPTTSDGAHTHSVTINATNTELTGGSGAVNHLNPYTVVYIWRRTA